MALIHEHLCMQAILVLILALFSIAANPQKLVDDASIIEIHEQWMASYGKAYNDTVEVELRLKVFKENVEFVESFNAAGLKPYKLSINEFSDQTNEEFMASHNGYRRPTYGSKTVKEATFRYGNLTDVPFGVDWRRFGAVTPVKNQGKCGSCWAFSAVATTAEGITRLTTGALISLSEQELMDCDKTGKNQGCKGGHAEARFEFIATNNGLTSEANYPYKGSESSCHIIDQALFRKATNIRGYESVPAGEDALAKAVAFQPVSVAIDGGGRPFQFYSGGVFDGDCGTELNHAVTVVGYGSDGDGTKYWIVKNSWGRAWGEDGFMRIRRGVEGEGGLCGIALEGSYPVVY